ncbi:Nuclear cap-binding protein subunit 3 [Eumeta japonica]|uniref:Nuclear cap-binding protein subunit 3 n=1 Tax=Eumeta variegata TaxID=151549 RepID=A0A4C1X260_EUMVA|nr:Nuclear cap-binding protein subunit 3 [Eumeta japonica]
MEKEEGEMSDDNSMVIEENVQTPMDTSSVLVYESKSDGLIIQKLGKADAAKLEERAKRFGLLLTGRKAITQKQIDELYENFGIRNGEERHFRFDTLHLYGVNGLTTKEIFEYLEDFRPVSIEWINNKSCNVVCQDHISAALALLLHSREISDKEVKQIILSTSANHWREGFPHPKKELILFRFATNSDKKDSSMEFEKSMDKNNVEIHNKLSKNPWGDLCKSWGIYDHQEILNRQIRKSDEELYFDDDNLETIIPKNKKLAKRLGKRGQAKLKSEDCDSDEEWQRKLKVPRMRMHADDEEINRNKNLKVPTQSEVEPSDYASLSIEVVNHNSPPHHSSRSATKLSDKFRKQAVPKINNNVHSRLGPRIETYNKSSSDEDSEPNIMSRVHKVSPEFDTAKDSSVWSRLKTNKHENKQKADLRQTIRSKKGKEDLRKKIDKSRSGRSPLRIEIDNEYYDSD